MLPPQVDASEDSESFGQRWLKRHFDKLISVSQHNEAGDAVKATHALPQMQSAQNGLDKFEQQNTAVELVKR